MKRFSLLIAFVLCLASNVASAQSVIRDAEIEADLRIIANPIFTTAGLNPSQIRIIVIGDDTMNAFVAGGQNLFLYTGLLLEAENVGELAGVIAHESGHMAGGHLIRMRDAMDRASIESIVAMIAGVAVGVGAGDSSAGVATAMGGSEFANRRILKHSRTLESSADQSALSTVERMGYSARPMADFLSRMSNQEVLPELQRSGYILTHPLSRERLDSVNAYVAQSRHKDDAWPTTWDDKFQRAKAKILAFTQPQRAEREYKDSETVIGRYARAIAAYRQGRIAEALTLLDGLQKQEPQNGFFYDTRGQVLFEQGRIPEATAAWRKAVSLEPNSGLIHLSLAQSLLQRESADTNEAIDHLLKARNLGEKNTSMLYRWLAVGYGRQGNEKEAKLALAEEALLKRDLSFAVQQAQRAKDLGKNDPTLRQRADDIIAAARRAQKTKSDQ